MTRFPVAYLRRSTADANSPGDVSRSVQESAVHALAERDGFDVGELRLFVDWARSADEEKSGKRTEYAAMLKLIEAGKVCCVYAYALDRLNRSLVLSAQFAKACEANDVKIVTHREGEVRQDAPAEWLRWTILATFGEYELRTIKTRAAVSLANRKDRGDKLGRARYGYQLVKEDGRLVEKRDEGIDLGRIVDAYRHAGSVLGACRKLDADGVPAPMGGTRWATSALTRIIENEEPDLLPRKTLTGRRQPASADFAHLLRCPFCKDKVVMLTPNMAKKQYYCRNGARDRATHNRYVVREQDLRPFLEAEAARYRPPADAVSAEGVEDDERRIRDRLARATELYLAGDENMPKDKYEQEKKRADRELSEVEGKASLRTLHPEIAWDVGEAVVNGALRSIWREVRLDEKLRPVEVEWIFPEMRA